MRPQDIQGKKEKDEGGEEVEEVDLGAGEESHLLNARAWYPIEDGHPLQGQRRLRPLLKSTTLHQAPD